MTTAEIVALVASIFTAISGISAAIACILTYQSTRPKIKLKIDKQQSHRVYTFFEDKGFALLGIDLINSSMISGMIDELCIIYEGKKYFVENTCTQYNPAPFEVKSFFGDRIEQNTESLHLKTPITVPGNSIVSGFVLFPTFPVIQLNEIIVCIQFRLIHKKFKRKIRRKKFTFVTPQKVYDGNR